MFFLPQFLLFLYISQIHTSFKPHDFSSPNPFISLLKPNPYFVRPPSFFCLISFISMYNPNPYFVETPIFFLPQFLLFLYISQIHTSFKPHDFSSPNSFISLSKPNPYFVRPPSFSCLISFISIPM